MSASIDEVRQEIITAFAPHWALNDAAHRQEHFEAVFQTGMLINEKLGADFNPINILFAAYFHDLFAWSRINHHELSFRYFLTADHPVIQGVYGRFPRHVRDAVAFACKEHRASFEGNFTGLFSELINSADRGIPGDLQGLIQRCYDHRLTTMPNASEDERMADAIKHLKLKSGSDGYARYPRMYCRVFGEQLELQRQAIDKL